MSYFMRADRYILNVYQGELQSVSFFGATFYGTGMQHRMYVDGGMLNKAMAEADQLIAKQVEALVNELNAVKEELKNLKEARNAEAEGAAA